MSNFPMYDILSSISSIVKLITKTQDEMIHSLTLLNTRVRELEAEVRDLKRTTVVNHSVEPVLYPEDLESQTVVNFYRALRENLGKL